MMRRRYTPEMGRVPLLVYRYMLVMSWGVFPVVLIAVFAMAAFGVGREPGAAAPPVTLGGVIAMAAVFVAMAALFWWMGRFARAQIARIRAGAAPWPWPR